MIYSVIIIFLLGNVLASTGVSPIPHASTIGSKPGGLMFLHGRGYEDKTYVAWKGMKYRCFNPNYAKYHCYGGRGITVADSWKNSFVNFQRDMGDAPEGFSLDRTNVNGNYEPGNCRWIPLGDQQRNKRDNRFLTANGKTQILSDWARELGLYHGHIRGLLNTGYSMEDIIRMQTDEEFKKQKLRENKMKMFCRRGHEKSGSNFYINSRGGRVCKTCERNRPSLIKNIVIPSSMTETASL